MLKHCGVETHGIQKWDPPTPEEALFISGMKKSIFINPFLLKEKELPDIVDILEYTKRTVYGMRKFFQITVLPKKENKSY